MLTEPLSCLADAHAGCGAQLIWLESGEDYNQGRGPAARHHIVHSETVVFRQSSVYAH